MAAGATWSEDLPVDLRWEVLSDEVFVKRHDIRQIRALPAF